MLVLLVLQVLIVYTFSFVYNDGVRERCLLSCHEHGTKKKFLVHMRTFPFLCPTTEPQALCGEHGQYKVDM